MPPVEIHESEQNIVMTVELPGLERKDVTIDIEDDVFKLRGEKRAEHLEVDEKKEFLLEERSYGSFERSFTLPADSERRQGGRAVREGRSHGHATEERAREGARS